MCSFKENLYVWGSLRDFFLFSFDFVEDLQASYTVSLIRFLNSNSFVSSFWILWQNMFLFLSQLKKWDDKNLSSCTCLLALGRIPSGYKSLLARPRSSPCPRCPRARPGSHSRSSSGLGSWWNASPGSLASRFGTCVCSELYASNGRTSTGETWFKVEKSSPLNSWDLAKVPMSTICW